MEELFRNYRGEPVRKWMEEHVDVPVLATMIYMVMVLYLPNAYMKHREPFNLKRLFPFWNLLLTVFSWVGAYHTVPLLYRMLFETMEIPLESYKGTEIREPGLYNTCCQWKSTLIYDGHIGVLTVTFILSKIPEMIDTAFLVFQKKPVIFLHWYHHITVMLFCWQSWVTCNAPGFIFCAMNYSVHAIMYFYYFMCSIGLRKMVRPFAPLITFLQIAQMFVGSAIAFYSLYHKYFSGRGCEVDGSNVRLGALMYISYFYLFSQLFVKNYMTKATKNGEMKPASKSSNKKK